MNMYEVFSAKINIMSQLRLLTLYFQSINQSIPFYVNYTLNDDDY